MAKLDPQETDGIAPGTVIDGRYKVVRSIGQGGSGLVYEVEHVRTGRKLALKALIEVAGLARLEQEARAASLMKNGHTAKIIDMEAGGPTGAYMVMELLDGQSLRGLLEDAGQLPLELTVNMAMQVCECLHEAHALGIIHRDLKPENVFLCPSPWPGQYDVKVLDFGVMKIADGGSAIPKSSLTRTGSTVGTPYYMSLEQLRNSSAVDARADVYSLGVVLYECLSGRKPFQADTIGDLVYALCSGPPTQLARLRPDLPAEICDMVMRTLSANRDDRPATMLDLAVALLPHANQAFSLWVKVDGKQPALDAPKSVTGRGAPPPRPSFAGAAPPPVDGVPPSSGNLTGPVPRPAPSLPRPAVPPPTPSRSAWGAPSEGAAEGRRDTPTEMYVKGVHDSAAVEEPESTGDRDTPTRAIALDALPPRARSDAPTRPDMSAAGPASVELRIPAAPRLPVTSSPAHPDPPNPPARPAPTFGAPPDAQAPEASPMAMAVTVLAPHSVPPPSAEATAPLQPNAAAAKMTMRLGDYMPVPAAPASSPLGAAAQPGAPPKPAWQEKFDRTLIDLGRFGERQAQRYRAAPKSTQIAAMIGAGTVAILLIGALVFLGRH